MQIRQLITKNYVRFYSYLCAVWHYLCNRLICWKQTLYTKILYIRFDKQLRDRSFFLITSEGQTATFWLAEQLNTHPRIACSHALSYPTRLEKEDPELARINRVVSKLRYIPDDIFWNMSLEEYLQAQAGDTGKPIVGNAHGFSLERLQQYLDKCNKRLHEKVVVVNMVRHPVSRFLSILKCWGFKNGDYSKEKCADWQFNDFEARSAHLTPYILDKYDVEFTNVDNLMFINALLQMEAIMRSIHIAREHSYPTVVYEQIVKDPIVMKELVGLISNGSVKAGDTWLRAVYNAPPVNVHSGKQKKTDKERFFELADWQQYGFRYIAEKHDFIRIYGAYGYDMSLLQDIVMPV